MFPNSLYSIFPEVQRVLIYVGVLCNISLLLINPTSSSEGDVVTSRYIALSMHFQQVIKVLPTTNEKEFASFSVNYYSYCTINKLVYFYTSH